MKSKNILFVLIIMLLLVVVVYLLQKPKVQDVKLVEVSPTVFKKTKVTETVIKTYVPEEIIPKREYRTEEPRKDALRKIIEQKKAEGWKELEKVRVQRAIDGDSIEVTYFDGMEVQKSIVRLWGIDAPELNQPDGLVAQYELDQELVPLYIKHSDFSLYKKFPPKDVIILWKSKDTNNQIIGHVFSFHPDLDICDDVNEKMVRRGSAWYYEKVAPNVTDMWEVQRDAQEKKIGIWDKGKIPVPPWEWRKMSKEEKEQVQKTSDRSSKEWLEEQKLLLEMKNRPETIEEY